MNVYISRNGTLSAWMMALGVHPLSGGPVEKFYATAYAPTGSLVPLTLAQHFADKDNAGYLFDVPQGLPPGWYEGMLAPTPQAQNGILLDAYFLFRVGS